YMSFGPERTKNLDTRKYFHNLTTSGHGSVFEHSNVNLLFYGISRSNTHELVRHRAGMAYSQLSQRYVDGFCLRFVERPEYQDDPELHGMFEEEIDHQAALYENIAQKLLQRQEAGAGILTGEKKRDRRKKVNQAARSVLGNHAEAPILVTGNLRAWRHVISMRASEHAEVEIRRAMYRAFLCLAMLDPITFGDFQITEYPDGTRGVTTPYPKV
ncbi:MAG: FAD-dependent thymidylate synthase, partial [bacterium]|nr:FAD-dependent thymidylate synthase [bacterium]